MATANDILKKAQDEIGYKEGSNNNNKYGSEYGMNNQPWCVIFIWWIFKQAGASSLFYGGGKVALCSTLYNYHKGKGQSVSTSSLKAGDVVFFDFTGAKKNTSHVGIVESVSGSSVITIEGNTSSGSSGSQSNGDGVYRRTRALKYISCAYRPAYEEKTCTVTLPEISKGSIGEAVKALQTLLVLRGYSVGTSGADGDFGGATNTAVQSFQKAKGLTVDGIVGANSWKALING